MEYKIRFYDLSWSQANASHPRGVIAGGLDTGSLNLWDAASLLEGSSEALISSSQKHTAALKTLQFSPFNQDLLATGGAKGELYITDLKNVESPTRLGNPAASRTDDIDSLDFNKCVPYILGTAGTNGFVTVWDLRSKKESLSLNNLNRKPISAIAWDPKTQYRLITAIPDDNHPLVLSWDLRNANAPLKQLQGHEGGVLSLSWCQQDESLLLSSGKDNRTICWNPETGEQLGELPAVTNWVFQTRWNPHYPNLLATASFDGRLTVQSIQSSDVAAPGLTAQAQTHETDDFFGKAQTTPPGSGLTLKKPPKWIERTCGTSFGFGGKLVYFSNRGASRTPGVRITKFQPDPTVGPNSEAFERTLKQGDLPEICESHIEAAKSSQEKADWMVIKTLTDVDPRQSLLDFMGFAASADEAADGISALDINGHGDGAGSRKALSVEHINGTDSRSNRLSSFFNTQNDGENFLTDLASTKGAKTNEPFSLFSGNESESDRRVTHALVLGQFDKALEICLQEGRLSDAFMVAICGGPECIEKAKKAYFNQQSGAPNYLRLLASVVGKNLWDVVYNADLENWSEVAAAICTFADGDEFPDLCEALGDRLLEESRGDSKRLTARKDASLCYLAGGKLEKISIIWIEELKENEESKAQMADADSSFSIHANLLQSLIEKVTVFREAIEYEDEDRMATSGWRLTPLYEKYAEFANIATAHGQMDVAKRYLSLLPDQFPAVQTAQARIQQALAPETQQSRRAATSKGPVPSKQLPVLGTLGTYPQDSSGQAQYSAQGSSAPNSVAPRGYGQAGGQGFGNESIKTYRPPQQPGQAGYQPMAQPVQQYGAPSFNQYGSGTMNNKYGSQAGSTVGPPPRASNASPAVLPPSQSRTLEPWNDTPFVTKAPTSRRGTPSIPQEVAANPYMFHPSPQISPAMAGPPVRASAAPPPPPPKGGTLPPRLTRGPQQQFQPQPPSTMERPSSSQYTPAATEPPASFAMPPAIPRGSSPYNAPPPVPAGTNRYAPVSQPARQSPAPSFPGPHPGQQARPTMQIQPLGGPIPAPNQSSMRPPQSTPMSRYGGPPQSSQPAPPPRGPGAPPISRPGTAASQTSQGSSSGPAVYRKSRFP